MKRRSTANYLWEIWCMHGTKELGYSGCPVLLSVPMVQCLTWFVCVTVGSGDDTETS